MRRLILILLAANLVFLMWQYWQPQGDASQQSPATLNVSGIQLVREVKSEIAEVPSIEVAEQPVVEEKIIQCFTLGPFTESEVVVEARQVIEKLSVHVSERSIEESELFRYWVYLPVKGGRNEAIERSKALAAENVKDYYIVQSGEYNHQISLGHFKDKRNAEERKAYLRKLGFGAELKALHRQYRLYWLDYEHAADMETPVTEVIAPYLQDDVARLTRECGGL